MAWAAALPSAALVASRPSESSFGVGYACAWLAYAIGGLICHQQPERSFQLFGAQLPVCARCTGIYVGAALASIVFSLRKREASRCGSAASSPVSAALVPPRGFSPAQVLLFVAALPTVATLAFEWVTGTPTGNGLRAASGALLGAAVAWIVVAGSGVSGRPGRLPSP